MSDSQNNAVSTYFIPDNFYDEPRIFMGALKRRNFIEGVVLSLVGLIPALLIPVSSVQLRITLVVILCAPFMLAGIIGYNGDPLSVAIQDAYHYKKSKCEMIYNSKSRLLKYSPLDDLLSQSVTRDKIVDVYEAYNEKRKEKIRQQDDPNEDYKFEYDPSIDDYTGKTKKGGEKNTDKILIQSKPKEEKISIASNNVLSNLNGLYDEDEEFIPIDYSTLSWAKKRAK